MKRINFSSRIYKKGKPKNEEISNMEKGVTKALLDKYKPKVLYYIVNFGARKVQRRLA